MSSTHIVVLSVLFYVTACSTLSLQVGNTVNSTLVTSNLTLVFVEEVKLSSIPLTTRTKHVFYTGTKTINALAALDRDNSKAKASIISGGVGFIFVNVEMKSERGNGLNYRVQVYV